MKVVTFSHEIGSFGKSVAMDLAQNAGLDFIPFSRVYQLALERNERFLRRRQDISEGRGDIDTWEGHFFSVPSFSSLFESIVLELASPGRVLLVGVGMQAVLAPFDGVLRVHVHAPLPIRVKRFMELNQVTVGEANQTIKWWDQRRRALLEINPIFEEVSGYAGCDLSINTERVPIPAASRLLQSALQEMPGAPDPPRWRANLLELALAKRVECAVREGGSALGLAPLEVFLAEDRPGALCLSGFVHTEEDAVQAVRLARSAAEGREVISLLKLLKLHGDLAPPSYWKNEE